MPLHRADPQWASYSATLGGVGWAIGNGTITASARISPTWVDFLVAVTFGSTSTYGAAAPTLTLAATPHSEWTDFAMRTSTRVVYADATGGNTDGRCALSGGVLLLLVENAAGTYSADAVVSSTVPHVWTNPDQIIVTGGFRPA